MNSELNVNLDQLDDVVARLSGLAGFLTDHLDQLDRQVATLSGSSWESAAASAYYDAHTRWANSAREFVDGVATMRDAAKNAHSKYTNAISRNSQAVRGG